MVVGVLFLEETHEVQKHKHDAGLAAGRWLLKTFAGTERSTPLSLKSEAALDFETCSLLSDDQPPEYRTTENTPRASCSLERASALERSSESPPPTVKAFTKQVILLIINFGILA